MNDSNFLQNQQGKKNDASYFKVQKKMFAITYKANDEVRHVYTVRLPIYISLYKVELVFMGIKQPAWGRSDLIKFVVLVNSAQSRHPHHIIPRILIKRHEEMSRLCFNYYGIGMCFSLYMHLLQLESTKSCSCNPPELTSLKQYLGKL